MTIERIDESGNFMTIADFYSNEILRGNLLFSKNPHYPMTITTKHPAVVLEIDKERLFDLFSNNNDFLKSYLAFISDHATILGNRIKHYVNKTIRECIMNYLEYERQKQNSNAWKRFIIIEANRIKEFLKLPEQAGYRGVGESSEISYVCQYQRG